MKHEQAYFYGYQPQCRGCEHRAGSMVHLGHPSPCSRVRWENQRHRLPEWEGEVCADFQRVELIGVEAE